MCRLRSKAAACSSSMKRSRFMPIAITSRIWAGSRPCWSTDHPRKTKQVYSGYSETNKLVNFTADHAEPGDLVQVRITEIHSWSLNGEKIEQPQPQAA